MDEVSDRQRKQMTTLGDNVATMAVEGKFDDCQALVKQAFADPDLADLNLSSANSINIGRLLPQSVYYVYAASRLADVAGGEQVVFSVPSGNFGDLMGGVLAMQGRAAGGQLRGGHQRQRRGAQLLRDRASTRRSSPSRVCISNAMNVGHPSNLARLVALYGGQMDEVGHASTSSPTWRPSRRDFFAVSIDDDETRATIGRVYRRPRRHARAPRRRGLGRSDALPRATPEHAAP